MDFLVAMTDGGTRANPGPGACAVWFPQLGEVVGSPLYHVTNNEAEYEGLLLALDYTLHLSQKRLHVYTDSQIMQRQILGRYSVKASNLVPYYEKSMDMIKKLEKFDIFHVPRSANKEADAECNRVMDEFEAKHKPWAMQ